jgi:tRNA pseudouridine55 synthase
MLGVLLIDKPAGISSHDVVNRVRRVFGTRRVGHAGTLDPLATGLLVVAVGPATRFLQYLSLEPKVYEARARFGIETASQDSEGEVVASANVPAELEEAVRRTLPVFYGEIQQIPPMYSAVKKYGKPLYALARQGIEVERKPRTVFIDAYDLLSIDGDEADFRIVCSGGTYVRTLIHDLGQRLGCGAHMIALRRTGAGVFQIGDSAPLDHAEPSHLIPLDKALQHLPAVELSLNEGARIIQGQRIETLQPDCLRIVMKNVDGLLLGIGRVEAGWLYPECVLMPDVVNRG